MTDTTDTTDTPAPSIVAYAKPSDFDGIMALIRLMYAEQSLFSFSEEKVASVVQRCVSLDNGIAGVVRDADATPIATIGMLIGSEWWTTDRCLIEHFHFVHPDHRRSDYAKKMIDFAKTCSDRMSDLKMPLLMNVIDSSAGSIEIKSGSGASRSGRKLRLYQRSLRPTGMLFMHNYDWANLNG